MKNKLLSSPVGLIVTAVALLIAVLIVSSLPRLRIDLTEDRLYTLSDATRNILRNLDRPIELTFFYSESAVAQVPQVRAYGARVQEMLREMTIASNGQLHLSVVDPEPFSEEEDLAAEFGIQAVPLAQGREAVYFGVVASDPATRTEADGGVYDAIPLIRPDQEEFLEYEFSRLLMRVMDPNPPVVGLLSTLDLDGGFDPARNQATAPWAVMDTVRYMYDVERVRTDADTISEDTDILMIVHPQELPPQTLYAIDQFVLAGGRALIFVDPNSDTQTQIALSGGGYRDTMASDLPGLLSAWGVDYDPTQVVTNREQALYVTLQQGQRPVAHYGMLGLTRDNSAFTNDVVTGQLQVMNMSSVGALGAVEDASTTFDPLILTTPETMLMGTSFFSEMGDPTLLIDEFTSEDTSRVIGARVSGPARSAFPDGSPVRDDADGDAAASSADHLAQSVGDIGVIVVSDTDVLADRMWAQSQQVAGQRVINAFASNGDFVINALDNLTGSSELVSIRSRGSYARPFTRVLALQRAADERLREEETNLLRRLSEAEQQLTALNREGATSISPEQEAEIERFIQQQVDTRRALRDVQFQLNREIDRLGSILKLINTALIPTLLVIGVVIGMVIRNQRRRRLAR